MSGQQKELRTDTQWSEVFNQPFKVMKFMPLAKVEDETVISSDRTQPYAWIEMQSPALPATYVGAITHRVDFRHLWAAYVEWGVGDREEVVVCWEKKSGNWFSKLVSTMLPGLGVMLCKAGACDLMMGMHIRPDLGGEERARAMLPLLHWSPETHKLGLSPVSSIRELEKHYGCDSNASNRQSPAVRRAYEAAEGADIPAAMRVLLDRLN